MYKIKIIIEMTRICTYNDGSKIVIQIVSGIEKVETCNTYKKIKFNTNEIYI